MKKLYIFLLLPIILFLLTGCEDNNNTNNTNNIRTTEPIAQNKNITNSNDQSANIQRIAVELNTTNPTNNVIENLDTEPAEIELSSFSTDILTSDPNRNNNLHLTCDKLNGHIVKPNETFSFTGLIGKSTSDKGYKEANIIEADGDTTKGLGGGNCQVSSTLYNAVAKIPELEVVERHNHAAEVHYVPLGQDAAVAYGSVDFKFKNNMSSSIKIYASTDDKVITIRIVKI